MTRRLTSQREGKRPSKRGEKIPGMERNLTHVVANLLVQEQGGVQLRRGRGKDCEYTGDERHLSKKKKKGRRGKVWVRDERGSRGRKRRWKKTPSEGSSSQVGGRKRLGNSGTVRHRPFGGKKNDPAWWKKKRKTKRKHKKTKFVLG